MSKWDEILGRIFRVAFGRGIVGRLRAAPKPSRAVVESLAGEVTRSTFRIFKNNCHTLPWVEQGEELDDATNGARADLLRSWNVYHDSLRTKRAAVRAESDWHQVLSEFRRHVADINRRIAAYNLKAPSASFRKSPLDAEREINRVIYGQ